MLRIVPIMSVPLSPINIFDVLPKTLCKKKGMSDPTESMAITVILPSPEVTKAKPKMAQANMQKPDDRPSTPSIILMALIMPVPDTMEMGMATYTGSSYSPKAPWKLSKLYRLIYIRKPMMSTSVHSLNVALSPMMSSIVPIYIMIVIATMVGKRA